MNAATIQHLADLKKAGFDISSLENQMRSSPLLDKQGDILMGGGILRQAQFTKITQDRAAEVKKYEQQIAQLSAMHNAGAAEDSPLYKAALNVIAEQQNLLLDAGFSEDQIKEISDNAIVKPTEKEPPVVVPPVVQTKKEGDEMGNDVDTSRFLDVDTFQKQAEAQIFGSASLAAISQHAMMEAARLGIEVPREKAINFGANLHKAVSEGKNIEQFVDEEFGLTAKRAEIKEANDKKAIDDAYAKGKAEGQRESGVPRRAVSKTKHPIYDNIKSNVVEPKKEENENKEIPRNKYGDQEIYRTRGDRHSRVAAAEEYHQNVLARTDAQNSIPSE